MNDFFIYQNSCAITTRFLNNAKREAWKKCCSNLNATTSIHVFWSTTNRFKKCIPPSHRFTNNDWFYGICSLVAMCYVPTFSEVHHPFYLQLHISHVLINPFSASELKFYISSRRSIASGLDHIC